MGDVFAQDVASGTRTKLTEVNPELKQMALGDLRPISWRSFDGKEIWGLLLTPPGWDGKRRLPLIVYCHGGPIGGVTYGIFPQFAHTVGQVDPYPTEALASAGYAVLFPMPRGGSGYGEAGHRAIINAWGEADYKDIMAGRRSRDRAEHRRSRSARRDGRLVRRLHDQLDRDADRPLQGRVVGRQHQRS